jgi:hypothetical protein
LLSSDIAKRSFCSAQECPSPSKLFEVPHIKAPVVEPNVGIGTQSGGVKSAPHPITAWTQSTPIELQTAISLHGKLHLFNTIPQFYCAWLLLLQ